MTIPKNVSPADPMSAALAALGAKEVSQFTVEAKTAEKIKKPTSNATNPTPSDTASPPKKTSSFKIPMASGYRAPPTTPDQMNADGSPKNFPNAVLKTLQRAFAKTPNGDYAVSDKMMLETKQELASFWGLPDGFLQADGKNLEFSESGKTGSAVDARGSFMFTLNGHNVGLNVFSEPKLAAKDIEFLKTPKEQAPMVTTVLGNGISITVPEGMIVTQLK